MALRINTNVAALNTHRQLADTSARLAVSMERLSSGYRINKAKDDVAGLAIANTLRMDVRSLRVAQQNAAQATAVLQMAEGGANKIETIIERLKELATSAASSNVDNDGRARLNAEASALLSEIDRIANDTKYGGLSLLSAAVTLEIQIGNANVATEDRIVVSLNQALTSGSLGLSTISLESLASSQAAIANINNSLTSVNIALGQIGAAQSRLEFASANLAISIENIAASESTIRDVDMAFEMVNFTKNQILLQAGTAMLAQANMAPQSILALLGGR